MDFNHLCRIPSQQHADYSLVESEVLYPSQADRALTITGHSVHSPTVPPTYQWPSKNKTKYISHKIQDALLFTTELPHGVFVNTTAHERVREMLRHFL